MKLIAFRLAARDGGAGGFSSTVHLMGATIYGEIHAIAEEPPNRFVYECTDTAGHYRRTMTLRVVGTSTELTQSAERLEGPLWVRVIHVAALAAFSEQIASPSASPAGQDPAIKQYHVALTN